MAKVINEGISSRVFHFCPLSAMYSIAKDDKIMLSSSDRASDTRMSGGYPYFLSLSRTASSAVGYQRMRISGTGRQWSSALVRIELDGRLLNSSFKGSPQNYFTDADDSKIKHDGVVYSIVPGKTTLQKKELNRYAKQAETDSKGDFIVPRGRPSKHGYTDYKMLDRNQMHEYEDRLVSNSPEIKNADKYIVRIDILMRRKWTDAGIFAQVGEIIRRYGKKVHIYNSEVAFNSFNVRNSIGANHERYGELDIEKFVNAYGKLLNSEYSAGNLKRSQGLIIAQCAYIAAYVESYMNGTPVKEEYGRILNEIGAEIVQSMPEVTSALSVFISKLSKQYNAYLTANIPKMVDTELFGAYRRYADGIKAVFTRISDKYNKMYGARKWGSGAYQIINIFKKVWNVKNSKSGKLVAESKLKTIISKMIMEKVGGFDPNDPNNQVRLVDDPKVRSGADWAKNGGNFPVERNGQIYYVSRSVSVSLCAFCRDSKNRWCVLANQRGPGVARGAGKWNVPSGFLDYGETAEEAAIRETWEETGVSIPKGVRLRHLGTNSGRLGGSQTVSMAFTCVLDGTTDNYPTSAEHCEPGEVSAIAWIPVMASDGSPLRDYMKYQWDGNPHKAYNRAKTALLPYIKSKYTYNEIIKQLTREIKDNPTAMYLLGELLKKQ